MSVVYEPQEDDNKIAFLQELRDIRLDCAWPWMICDDFSLIYRDEDKNNGNLNHRVMGRFRLINDLALKEVYLNGRRYTWSNEQSRPPLSTSTGCCALRIGRNCTGNATYDASRR